MESLEELVAAHGAALLRLAFMLTGSADSAQDLMQDTCVKLHRHWPKVARADSPLAYSKRVMVNEFTRNANRRSTSEVPVPEPFQLRADPAGGVFEGAAVDRDRLWSLLTTLAPSERAAVVLRYYEDLSDFWRLRCWVVGRQRCDLTRRRLWLGCAVLSMLGRGCRRERPRR